MAGSAEAFYLWLAGPASLTQVVFGFLLPTLAGNLFGGTLLFAVLTMRRCAKRSTRLESAKR